VPQSNISDGQISIFISYAHEDEKLCARLIAHLSGLVNEGIISHWYDGKIVAGELWDSTIQTQLTSAQLILLLVSADFLASDYVNRVELPTATTRHKAGEAWTIPIILSPCDWQRSHLKDFEALPKHGKPITTWKNRNEAFLSATDGIRAAIERISVLPLCRPLKQGRVRVEEQRKVIRPGIFRYFLDRYLPSLHRFVSNLGTISKPSETDVLNSYLRDARAEIENDIRQKTYIPLEGKEVSSTPLQDGPGTDPFVPPMQRVIRQVVGLESGGDSASAQIAAVNRNNRVIRNIMRTLLRSKEPLVLLGDPGTGKTMSLQQAALSLFESQIKRVFPIVTLYVRLGEFYVSGRVTPEDVWKYVKTSVSPQISPYLEDLERSDRLIVLFDGMDEMSRERYSEHTEALSIFAAARKGRTKTLFSCRITDFSPKFLHRRLVLLPFNDSQIADYLRRNVQSFPIKIEGKEWALKRLVRELRRGSLPLEATNPFVLWLLCYQLQHKGSWPNSRVELLRYYIEETYRRKSKDLAEDDVSFPPVEKALAGWSKFAYTITALNRGSAIGVTTLASENGFGVEELIRIGERCGVLQESNSEEERQIRFEHHRFQEFFTALFINHNQAEIAWLDKLDAPRWQETMLNLILMGGGEDAIRTLADAIDTEIDLQAQIKWHQAIFAKTSNTLNDSALLSEFLSPQSETILADRIELASRIVRQASSTSELVKTRLAATFEKAVNFLAAHGNPITQVKMMRACQNVPEIDIFHVLQNSLKSPINWVRNQALIIVSSSNRSALAVGSHFATELGYDLASGTLPLRFKAYCKAAAASKQKRNWWCLAMVAFAFLFNVAVLLSAAGLLYFIAWNIVLKAGVSLDVRIFVAMCVLLMIAAISVSLKLHPGKLWFAILATGVAADGLAFVIDSSRKGLGIVMGTLIFTGIMTPFVAGFIVIPLALGVHSLALVLYWAATTPVGHSVVALRSYFAAMWRNSAFEESFTLAIKAGKPLLVFSLMMVVLGLVGGLVLGLLYGGVNLLGKLFHLPFSPWVNVAVFFASITLLGVMVVALKYRNLNIIYGFFKLLAATSVIYVLILGVMGILYLLIILLSGLTGPNNVKLTEILTITSAVLVVIALLSTFWFFRRSFQFLFEWTKDQINDRPLSPEQWKSKLAAADPDLQQLLLHQTNHQTLGVKADDFLRLLEEVATSIEKEPALSTYWEKRDRLEQVLRQERQG
jgi:TIR domain/NACHT domain